jgi:hypothetical protein
MTDVEYSTLACRTILNEIVSLLSKYHENLAVSNQLRVILSEYLGGNTKLNNFLSFCCYGRKGVVVSLHEFNELCILPRTDWKFRLVAKQPSDDPALVSPFLLENQERESLIVNKFISTQMSLLLVLEYVIQQHPRFPFIRLHIPNEIPISWTLAILGLKHKSSNFTPPSIGTIRQRITISMDKSIKKNECHT